MLRMCAGAKCHSARHWDLLASLAAASKEAAMQVINMAYSVSRAAAERPAGRVAHLGPHGAGREVAHFEQRLRGHRRGRRRALGGPAARVEHGGRVRQQQQRLRAHLRRQQRGRRVLAGPARSGPPRLRDCGTCHVWHAGHCCRAPRSLWARLWVAAAPPSPPKRPALANAEPLTRSPTCISLQAPTHQPT